jgi:hypothetical protein
VGLVLGAAGGVLLLEARERGQLDQLRSRGIELKARVGEELKVRAQELRPVVSTVTENGYERELREAERELDAARRQVNGEAEAPAASMGED